MIDATVRKTGPLFEPNLDARCLAANMRTSNLVGPKLATALASNYSGGITRRGPGRYGHLADSVRWVTQVSGDQVATRVRPQGRPAFKALFLEKGTRGPHRRGASGVLLPKDARDRRARRAGHAAALKIGAIFRRSAQPHGAPAYHVMERTLERAWPALQPLYAAELAKETGGEVGR